MDTSLVMRGRRDSRNYSIRNGSLILDFHKAHLIGSLILDFHKAHFIRHIIDIRHIFTRHILYGILSRFTLKHWDVRGIFIWNIGPIGIMEDKIID
jgi:hypothetical protein